MMNSEKHKRGLTQYRLRGDRLRGSMRKSRLEHEPPNELPHLAKSSTNSSSTLSNNKHPVLSKELVSSIKLMVRNISKSFIVGWYGIVSQTNHDFVASCDALIENTMLDLAERCTTSLDKHRTGQIVANLLHSHILSASYPDQLDYVFNQIDQHEYDICESFVIKLYDLFCNDQLRDVIWTSFTDNITTEAEKDRNNDESHDYKKQTSALYSLVIAMLAKSVFMPIVDSISYPKWLYAIIIWFCEREEEARKNQLNPKISKPEGKSHAINSKNQKSCNGIKKSSSSTNCDVVQKQMSSARSTRSPSRDEQRESKEHLTTPTIITTNSATSDSNIDYDDLQSRLPVHTNRDFTRVNDYPDYMPTSSTLGVSGLSKDRGSRSLDLEEGFDVTSAINFDAPICDSLKRPLENIKIYATEEVKASNSTYVLYCITYDGLFHFRGSDATSASDQQPFTHIIDSRQSTGSDGNNYVGQDIDGDGSGSPTSTRKSYRKRMTIKRRFREFVLLQLRLEENPKIRPYLKNIPKPTKLKAATQNIFSIPGITNIKLDQSTIKLRQRFLERFLLALNNSPFIANSFEFKEFFSYNLDPTTLVNISKSKSLILQVNLNKVFVETLRSALGIIRASLPGDEYNQLGSNHDPDAWLVELQRSTLRLHVQTRTSHSKMNLERVLDSKLISLSAGHESANNLGRHRKKSSDRDDSGMRKMFNSSILHRRDSKDTVTNDFEHFYDASSDNMSFVETKTSVTEFHVPIAARLIDIVHYATSGDAQCSYSIVNMLTRFILGSTIERYSKILLDLAFTVDNAAFCINGITKSIWPEEEVLPPLDVENGTLETASEHLARLIEQRYLNFAFLPKAIIHSILSRVIRFYLSQLSSQQRNKYVIYSFFNQLMDELEKVESSV